MPFNTILILALKYVCLLKFLCTSKLTRCWLCLNQGQEKDWDGGICPLKPQTINFWLYWDWAQKLVLLYLTSKLYRFLLLIDVLVLNPFRDGIKTEVLQIKLISMSMALLYVNHAVPRTEDDFAIYISISIYFSSGSHRTNRDSRNAIQIHSL